MKLHSFSNQTFPKSKYYQRLPDLERRNFDLLAQVFHFKVNSFVLDHLIDWSQVPEDPIYQYIFPRAEMLEPDDLQFLHELKALNFPAALRQQFLQQMRARMQPKNVSAPSSLPKDLDGLPIQGMYSNFPTIVSLFPAPMVLTCHSYCNYCFRWITFGNRQVQTNSSYQDPYTPISWLKANPQISDVLFTGADPLSCSAKVLQKYIAPILEVDSVQVVRISSKSLAYWPFRFTTDKDADPLLRLFDHIVSQGKHLNFCAHYTHPRELEHPEVAKAVQRIRNTGATIRTQGPLIRRVNDRAEIWADMWKQQIQLGMVPYYMFMEADHHPQPCFRVPPAEALRIFQEAQKTTTGLARTVRGPVFMYDLNRVRIEGTTTMNGQRYFVLKTLQAPPGSTAEGDIKLVPYDEHAMDLGNLHQLFQASTTRI